MSYADTGDDELDYGEGELGEGVTAGVSLGALQEDDDDDIAQDCEYDDLYDDVNIGYFEVPTAAAGDDRYEPDDDAGCEQKSDASPRVHVESEATEHRATIAPQIVASVPLPSPSPAASVPQPVKVEQEEVQDGTAIPRVSARLGTSLLYPGQKRDYASRSVGAVDGIQGCQMQLLLSPSTKDHGAGYNNGIRQGGNPPLHIQEKTYSPAILNSGSAASNGNAGSGSIQTRQVGGHAGGDFSVGPVRTPNDHLKERGVMDDMSYERTRGTTSLPRPAQRDVSPIMIESENLSRSPYVGDGNGMLFVGELHWWTTDAELEAALSEYGRVRNLKFFEERVSGKSKGYCQVDFYDHAAAVACKHGMNGRRFHDRPCIVALGNPKSIQQLGYQQEKKTQAQFQAQQEQLAARRNSSNSGGGSRGGLTYQERDSGRGYGRMGSGRMSINNKTGQGGGGRGRGNYMNKGMGGGGGSNVGAGMPYGQGHAGPMGGHQSAMMMHQGMMGHSYDQAYGPMGRGAGTYGGYVIPGPPFPGMVAPFPAMGPAGLAGIAPHVNPAFFGRPNGMGLMTGASIEGLHQGMWGDAPLGGWGGGEEQDRRTRDGSYMGDGAGMDYVHSIDMGHEKSRNSGARDKENGDWLERYRRDVEWEREGYKEKDKDQKDRDRNRDKSEEWDRDRLARLRYRSGVVEEEDDPRQRLREEEYVRKRSRMMEDRTF